MAKQHTFNGYTLANDDGHLTVSRERVKAPRVDGLEYPCHYCDHGTTPSPDLYMCIKCASKPDE